MKMTKNINHRMYIKICTKKKKPHACGITNLLQSSFGVFSIIICRYAIDIPKCVPKTSPNKVQKSDNETEHKAFSIASYSLISHSISI